VSHPKRLEPKSFHVGTAVKFQDWDEDANLLGCDTMQFLMFQRSLVLSSAESNRIIECVTLEAKHHFPSKHQEFNSQWQGGISQETGVCSSTTLRTSNLADFCISEGLPKLWKSEEHCIVWHVLSYWMCPVTSRKQVLEVTLYHWSCVTGVLSVSKYSQTLPCGRITCNNTYKQQIWTLSTAHAVTSNLARNMV